MAAGIRAFAARRLLTVGYGFSSISEAIADRYNPFRTCACGVTGSKMLASL